MRIHRASVFAHGPVGRAVSGSVLLILLGLISCSESTQPTTGLDASHGAIAVSIYVKQDASQAAPSHSVLAAASNPINCESLGIGIMTIQAQDSGGTLRGSGDFACADHQGTLTGIPAGSGYTVTVIGKSSANGPIVLQGEVTGITVSPNSTVPAPVGLARPPWVKKNPENVAVSVASNSQRNPGLAPDGMGGAVIVWEDNRAGTGGRIYAQRIDNQGLPRWRANGVPIDSTSTATQRNPKVVNDDNGGARVVWEDARNDESDLYVGNISPNGVAHSAGPIVQVSNAQRNPQVISDGSIIVWEDARNGNFDVYAQRLSNPQWTTNGRAVSQAAGDQKNPQGISDGAGGAIIVWEDTRNGHADIYAQRINASGAPMWRVDGVIQDVAVSQAANDQTRPQLVGDGTGGAIIVWQDGRTGVTGVYAQRLNSEGVAQWSDNGVVVRQDEFDVFGSFAPNLVSDNSGGAIIGWRQNEGGGVHIFAQRLSGNGAPVWTSSGVTVSFETLSRFSLVSDRAGGAIFAYADHNLTDDPDDIAARRLNSAGVTQWRVAVSTQGESQLQPDIVEDGAGGAIVVWEDFRNGDDPDIYAQGINATGAP